MVPRRASKPTATATIEPVGRRTQEPRDHSIKVMLEFSAAAAKYADRGHVTDVARRALGGFSPTDGEADRREVGEPSAPSETVRLGTSSSGDGVEASVIWRGRPGDELMETLRAGLLSDGYRVVLRERRECVKPGCAMHAVVDWNQPTSVPKGWYSNVVCGKHNYRECSGCKSLYVMTSVNSSGRAPSVHCEVCGVILIEWGGSKIWSAELEPEGTLSPR
jgi:hypothetical protein